MHDSQKRPAAPSRVWSRELDTLITDVVLNKWKDWLANSLFSLVHVYFWEGIQTRKSPFSTTGSAESFSDGCKL